MPNPAALGTGSAVGGCQPDAALGDTEEGVIHDWVKLQVSREIFPTRIKEEIEAHAWWLQGQSGASPTGGGKERGHGHSWELK